MRFAIISVTKEGQKLASNIELVLKNDPTVIKVDLFHKNVKDTVSNLFNDYDCWVAIMATGIMVRSICPIIKSKLNDPAVLVVAENKKHVISLLSGHMGGGNKFSIKIAGVIGAVPVITTATDLNGKMGIDSLANQYWFDVKQPHLIKDINQLIAENEKVDLYIPSRFRFLENHPLVTRSYRIHIWEKSFIRASLPGKEFDKELDLYPKRIVAGLGSKKGVAGEQVFFAIRSALQHLHLPLERLDALATADLKKDEEGIIDAASKSDLSIEIVTLNEIADFKHVDCTPSKLVQREFGVQGVSEPVSLIRAGENSRLILKKTAYNGVTVAIAVSTN
ncbi:MAG: cobalt-precorrin 5A hydrolase [Methanobacterium sp.]|nr:cobalt-precorrin 5A hydrolase [Methanobacterium sp.]